LRAFLRSRLPIHSDADDVLQDVFVRVLEKIDSLRRSSRIESWVYQIARNAIADFYRRRVPRPTESVEDVAVPHADEDQGNLNRPLAAWLSLMIGALPAGVQEAVRMYEIDGLSQAEIARRQNISLSAAKSRVHRGRRQLEELLRSCCRVEVDRRGNVIECRPATADRCGQVLCECSDDGK